jgi:hypothetical protein
MLKANPPGHTTPEWVLCHNSLTQFTTATTAPWLATRRHAGPEIQNAATDGNPRTKADPAWTPLVTTPPIPDYDSGHSVEGGAAAQVLKQFFGTDHVRFAACSYTLPPGQTCTDASPVLRRYASFTQASDENGLSRILVGFHFPKAVKAGIAHGTKIGAWAVGRFLRPVH